MRSQGPHLQGPTPSNKTDRVQEQEAENSHFNFKHKGNQKEGEAVSFQGPCPVTYFL